MGDYRSSASQVDTAELCLRKWAGLKIEKIAVAPNKFAAAGSESHGYLKRWFIDGTPPPNNGTGKTAQAILLHLPPPNTHGLEAEQEFRLTLGGVEFLGYIDLRNLTPLVPWVSDHKTTSDLCWAKEPDELVEDVQATLYAYDAMCRTNKREADLQWTYGTRHAKPKTKPVRRRVTFDEIKPRLDKTSATAAMLAELHAAQPYWLDVPYDAGGCETFGGCPFRDRCNLSPQERIQSIMGQETQHSAFLAKLRNKRGGGNAEPQPHPAPAVPASVPATSGTVNPPSAPETAATAPPTPSVAATVKARKKRRTKAEMAADKAAEADATKDTNPPETPQSPPTGSTAVVGTRAGSPAQALPASPVAQVAGNVLDMLNAQFIAGFKAGFQEGRES